MTSLENMFSHFGIENAVANYGRMGHDDEMMVDGQTGIQYFEKFHTADTGQFRENPNLYGIDYENFLRNSEKAPMCTARDGWSEFHINLEVAGRIHFDTNKIFWWYPSV